jgi:hypothetical protein
MSQVQNVQPLSLPEAKEHKATNWNTPVFWIGFLAFVLVALLAYATLSTSPAIGETREVVALSTNPELMAAHRYAEIAVRRAESDHLATNPELIAAQRYAGASAEGGQPLYSVANPELLIADRYTEMQAKAAEASGMHQNPELKVVGRYLETSGATGASFLSINPEIKAHLRFLEADRR